MQSSRMLCLRTRTNQRCTPRIQTRWQVTVPTMIAAMPLSRRSTILKILHDQDARRPAGLAMLVNELTLLVVSAGNAP